MFRKIYFKIKNYLIIVITPPPKKIVSSFLMKVIGKMKDEAAGMVIKEYIGLRSKKYSYETNKKNVREYLSTP